MRMHLPILRSQELVTVRRLIMMESKDGTIIEVFELPSKEPLEAAHTNATIQMMWEDYEKVCEYIPIGEVEEAGELFSEFSPIE